MIFTDMKKIIGVLMILSTLSSCDDGDMVFENLNFNGKAVQKCEDSELYFKINNTELLLVDFTSKEKKSLLDSVAPILQTFSIQTSAANQIYYRTYNSTINTNAICSILAPATPKVTAEYTSIPGGTIKYVRNIIPTVNKETGNVAVKYLYNINFENITLSNSSQEIKYATYAFGDYIYKTNNLPFVISNIDICENNILFATTNKGILQLALPETISFPKNEGTQTINLNTTTYLDYTLRKDNKVVNNCEVIPEESIGEHWTAKQGQVVIESKKSTTNASQFIHIIKIVNATFKNPDDLQFLITDQVIGTYNPDSK